MARSLTEIYLTTRQIRDQYLELTEFRNSSKMSVLDAFTWVVSSCILIFEVILDTFKIDLAKDLQNRVNGTPSYYANCLLKYQSGDELIMNDEGTSFSYAAVNEDKRVVKKVSYSEFTSSEFFDNILLLKIATGEPGAYERIENDELLAIRAYVDQIKFAGVNVSVVSREGDILIPRVTVYYDGAISENEVYKNIENSLNDFIANVDFNGVIYAQKVIDAIQKAEHVADVYMNREESDYYGIFIVQYNDDNTLHENAAHETEQRIERMITPNSGFIKQSSRTGLEADIQTWRESIVLKIEGRDQ